MEHKWERATICVLTGLVALTAIVGGVAMLAGADRFPSAWLQNTFLNDYPIPALVLAIVVGGSSFIAAVTIFTGREAGLSASMAAGLLLVGYIVVELVVLNDKELISWIEGLYLALGLMIFGLAAHLSMIEVQAPKASSIGQTTKQVSHL